MDFEAIKSAAKNYQADMAHFLREMISHPSESCQEKDVVACIRAEMEKLGFDQVEVDGLGNVIGAAIGAVIMSSIGRLLVFIGLPSTYNNTNTGTMLIVIVVIDALAQRRSIEMTRRKRLLSRTADQEGGAKE